MDCARSAELLSDHLEETLADPLRSELEAHLAVCADCSALRDALAEVVVSLKSLPSLDPPATLAERAAQAALDRPRVPERRWAVRRPALRIEAVAAVLAVAATGAILLGARGVSSPDLGGSRFAERAVSTGTYLLERKDRFVEDLRILRVFMSTILDGRLDRLNDRVDDYRRLLEKRRGPEPDGKKKSGAAEGGAVLTAEAPPGPEKGLPANSESPGLVKVCENHGEPAAGPPAPEGAGV